MFVESQGSAYGRFTRAIQRGNFFAAEMAARELRRLSLEDALAPIVLVSRWEAPRFDRAAVRWHGRLEPRDAAPHTCLFDDWSRTGSDRRCPDDGAPVG